MPSSTTCPTYPKRSCNLPDSLFRSTRTVVWKRVTEYLSILKCVRPPHIYVSVFAAISAGAFGTQSGLISLPFIKGPPPSYQGPRPSPSFEFRSFTSIALKARFDRFGYSLPSVRSGKSDVPRLFISQLPGDFPQVKSTTERKDLFLRGVLPLVLRVNERLSRDRSRLLQIEQQIKTRRQPSDGDAAWLANLEELYSVAPGDLRSLIRRVDQVPVSLALAQAAIESGWGTSRFAMLGNALFGQWTENPDVPGLLPAERGENQFHRVRAFSKLIRSVWKYAHNLNTHQAYKEFRLRRSETRQAGKPLSGNVLALTLTRYSERGSAYTEELHTIIRVNRLNEFDRTKIVGTKPTGAAPTS